MPKPTWIDDLIRDQSNADTVAILNDALAQNGLDTPELIEAIVDDTTSRQRPEDDRR